MAISDVLKSIGGAVGTAVPIIGGATAAYDIGSRLYDWYNQPSAQNQQQQPSMAGMQPQGNIAGDVAQVPLYNQGQQDFMSQILKQLSGQISQPDMGFGDIEKQSNLNLKQNVIPSIMERLTSLRGDSLGGGDISQALGGAAVQNQGNLDALKAQYKQGMFGPLMNSALTQQNQTFFQPQGPGFFSSAGQGLASGVGQAIPMGAVLALLSHMYGQQAGGNPAANSQYAAAKPTQGMPYKPTQIA